VSVGNYLHGVSKVYDEKVKKRKDEEAKLIKELSSTKFVQKKSMKMLGKYEREKLLEIFGSLDSDQDGAITATKIDIDRTSVTKAL